MRLLPDEANAIREEIRRFDPAAKVYLFGSRADDAARGGDIDLLVISDNDGFRELLRLRRTIFDRIGRQQLDLIVRRHNEANEPLVALAVNRGIEL